MSGAIGGNVDLSGFTITREGNTLARWNNPGLNSAGVAIQGLATTGAVIHDHLITGNRSAIDITNSGTHTVRNNVITDNHTGLIFRSQTDNLTVTENAITANRTVGVLFLDASGGTNSPVQTAAGSVFTNNISGNWYAQIVDRQFGGSPPAPGTTNLKDFGGNGFGTTAPVITSANSPGQRRHPDGERRGWQRHVQRAAVRRHRAGRDQPGHHAGHGPDTSEFSDPGRLFGRGLFVPARPFVRARGRNFAGHLLARPEKRRV